MTRKGKAKASDPIQPKEGIVPWVARIAGGLIDFAETRNVLEEKTDAEWRAYFAAYLRDKGKRGSH